MRKCVLSLAFIFTLSFLFFSCSGTLPTEFPPSNFKVSYVGYYDASGTSSSRYFKVFTWDDDDSVSYYNLYAYTDDLSIIKENLHTNYYIRTVATYYTSDPKAKFLLDAYKNNSTSYFAKATLSVDSSYYSTLNFNSSTGEVSWTEFVEPNISAEKYGGCYILLGLPYRYNNKETAFISASSTSSSTKVSIGSSSNSYKTIYVFKNNTSFNINTDEFDYYPDSDSVSVSKYLSYYFAVYVNISDVETSSYSNGSYYFRMTPWTQLK